MTKVILIDIDERDVSKEPTPDTLDEIVLRREYRSYFGVYDYKVYREPEENLTKWGYVHFHSKLEGQVYSRLNHN